MADTQQAGIRATPAIRFGNPNDNLPTCLMDDTVAIMDDLTATMGQPQSVGEPEVRIRATVYKPGLKSR